MKRDKGLLGCLCWGFFLLWFCGAAQAESLLSTPVDTSRLTSFIATVASAYVNAQANSMAILTQGILREENVQATSQLLNSVNQNTGLININQASGNLNNQTNQRVLFFSADPSAGLSIIEMGQSAQVGYNEISSAGGIKQDLIEGSFQNNSGMLGINQASGSLNIQNNTLVLAIGGVVSLSEADLGAVSAPNTVAPENHENRGPREDVIRESFANNQGMVQVIQSAGDLNFQGNALGFSFREINLR